MANKENETEVLALIEKVLELEQAKLHMARPHNIVEDIEKTIKSIVKDKKDEESA